MTKLTISKVICKNKNVSSPTSIDSVNACQSLPTASQQAFPKQKKLFPTAQFIDPVALSRKKAKGLSNVTHLTATLNIKMRQNGEAQAFIHESYGGHHGEPPNPKGRKKGEIVQSGLTSRGRRTIRIVSDCYQQLVLNKDGFYERHKSNVEEYNEQLGEYNRYSRFITLTFRNIIPDDKTAKKLLDNFFKRLRRNLGYNPHYLWVAERQKRGAIHFHILTPEKIVDDSNLTSKGIRVQENVWINRVWNEVVCGWAYRAKRISKSERDKWISEYDLSESYYTSLASFRAGDRATKPDRPAKSKFMLLPNCVHVNSAGNYMAKYISKENQNIVGGMYGASKVSRILMEAKVMVQKDFQVVTLGNEVIKYMYHRAKSQKIFVAFNQLEHNESMMIWCKQGWKLMEWYFEFLELKNSRKRRVVTGRNMVVTA